jgi:hypothetical protein
MPPQPHIGYPTRLENQSLSRHPLPKQIHIPINGMVQIPIKSKHLWPILKCQIT